ncbi:hypothetical protein Aaci_2044 [Alicyclobacillus acidocaldarius subsp. acidocaldarius DSM 446]|uniref:Uncharacterized protein n=2 Tax=Alicyclobacillus acidocaldarius TaxID=405212 RepID=C8WQB1_ALIAD|nr:hypothetical protein Aaci_2044 [Alicyclobacillus acidocaldarius subsp. acidocaldarius DSM 446]
MPFERDGGMRLVSRCLQALGRNPAVACAAIAAASLGFWAPRAPEAFADASVSMATAVGYGGYYVADEWVPVHVFVRNEGPAGMAKLVLRVGGPSIGDRRVSGEFTWPLWLPKGGSASTFIDVPGSALSQGTALDLVAGDRVISTSWLGGNSVSHVDLVGVVSDSSQATQFLAGTSADGTPVLPVALRPYDLPTSAQALANLSALVASVDELRALSNAQARALATWVDQGGLLIVTGTGLAPPAFGLLPISPGAFQVVDGDPLASFAGTSGGPGQIESTAGQVAAEARLWAGSNAEPLVASESFGRGQIWQTSFSPLDPDLLAWPGNAQMWTALFHDAGVAQTADAAVSGMLRPTGGLSLTSVGDALEPLRMPGLSTFALVLLGYLVAAGPVTFYVLRRVRRAALAWVILPALSGLTTVGIFALGGSSRPAGLLMNGVGVMDLLGDGRAFEYGALAIMSPDSGNDVLRLPPADNVLTLQSDNQPVANARIEHGGDATLVSLTDVPRWHVRYVFASGFDEGAGRIQCNFKEAYGLLFGTVTNETQMTLTDVAVVYNGTLVKVGTLAPGQTRSLNASQEVPTSSWISDYGVYNRQLTHGIGRTLGAYLSGLAAGWREGSAAALVLATADRGLPELAAPSNQRAVASEKTLVLVREYAPVMPVVEAGS